jgi:uroporphyrinogen-III synthase
VRPAVLTRDADAVAPYAAALAPLGLATVAMPVTRVAPASDVDRARLAHAVAAIDRYDAIVVASANAVAALLAALGARRDIPAVWAVGPATAAALLDGAGIVARMAPARYDASGLGAAVVATGVRRVLVPRADGGRDDAIAALEAAGATVDAITAYQTVARDPADRDLLDGLTILDRGTPAAVCLFAPSQVAALDEILRARGMAIATLGCPLVAIGATTGAAITAAGAPPPAVAATPTPAGMAAAVATVYPGDQP